MQIDIKSMEKTAGAGGIEVRQEVETGRRSVSVYIYI